MGVGSVKMIGSDAALDALFPIHNVEKKVGLKSLRYLIKEWKKGEEAQWQILGVAAFLINDLIEIPNDLRKSIYEVIDEEYEIACEWDNPTKRRRELNRFRKALEKNGIY